MYALALSPDGKIIACGRQNGTVQRWTTDGEMIEGVWTGHKYVVQSLSWSPSGSQIASGTEDGTVLIQNAKSAEVEVGAIKVGYSWVLALAYSPSGDRIASSGGDTIYIWDTQTGEFVVGSINGLGNTVTSLVWSSDSTKLSSASNKFACVFDSRSGELLYSLQHDYILWSVAFSPENNVLACVGMNGVAQLWNTESHQPLGQPLAFHQNHINFRCHNVTFSQDGRYLAYGDSDNNLTLWMVKDIAPRPPSPTLPQQSDKQSAPQKSEEQSTQQETRPNSRSLSYLDADVTGGGGFIEEPHETHIATPFK